MRNTRFIILGLFTIAIAACTTTKQATTELRSRTTVGNAVYVLNQNSAVTDCNFHKLSQQEAIGYIVNNHDGDRDDRVPRKLLVEKGPYIEANKSATHENRISTKVCMDKQGKVVGYTHDQGHTELIESSFEDEMFSLKFDERSDALCVSCTTKSFWVPSR